MDYEEFSRQQRIEKHNGKMETAHWNSEKRNKDLERKAIQDYKGYIESQ